MQLHEFIQVNMESIVAEWEQFAKTLPPGHGMAVSGLRGQAEEILEAIVQDMSVAQSREEQQVKSKGQAKAGAGAGKYYHKFVRKHTSNRLQSGFTVGQIVSEYRALRASVIRLWTQDMASVDKDALYQLTRFNEGIDQSLTYAIQEFSEQQVEQSRQHFLRDIAKREQGENALREVARQKDEFLATLAHELRNPLAPIQTGIDILRLSGNKSGDECHSAKTLDMMGRQMAHLVHLVDDLLNMSRISQGKVKLSFEKVDIRDAIRQAVDTHSTGLYAGNRQVSLDLPSEPLTVAADTVRLAQMIGNLLSNVGKYTAENGHIWISASRAGHQAKISVRDDGIGIAPHALNKLFQMFMQVGTARTGGLGIGLALVRKLVDLHGGTVEAHSEGLERGSEFIITLPLVQNEASTTPQEIASKVMVLHPKRALVVDDNEDAAESLGMLLELLDSEVHIVNNGPAALALLETFHPDLILLDIGMPEMDGYEVARRIRAHKAMAGTRLVAVTGWGQEADRQRGLQAGFDDHLIKPINMKDLERVVASSGA